MLWMALQSVLVIEAEVLQEDELSKLLGLVSVEIRAESVFAEAHFLILTPDSAKEICLYLFESQESVMRLPNSEEEYLSISWRCSLQDSILL